MTTDNITVDIDAAGASTPPNGWPIPLVGALPEGRHACGWCGVLLPDDPTTTAGLYERRYFSDLVVVFGTCATCAAAGPAHPDAALSFDAFVIEPHNDRGFWSTPVLRVPVVIDGEVVHHESVQERPAHHAEVDRRAASHSIVPWSHVTRAALATSRARVEALGRPVAAADLFDADPHASKIPAMHRIDAGCGACGLTADGSSLDGWEVRTAPAADIANGRGLGYRIAVLLCPPCLQVAQADPGSPSFSGEHTFGDELAEALLGRLGLLASDWYPARVLARHLYASRCVSAWARDRVTPPANANGWDHLTRFEDGTFSAIGGGQQAPTVFAPGVYDNQADLAAQLALLDRRLTDTRIATAQGLKYVANGGRPT